MKKACKPSLDSLVGNSIFNDFKTIRPARKLNVEQPQHRYGVNMTIFFSAGFMYGIQTITVKHHTKLLKIICGHTPETKGTAPALNPNLLDYYNAVYDITRRLRNIVLAKTDSEYLLIQIHPSQGIPFCLA